MLAQAPAGHIRFSVQHALPREKLRVWEWKYVELMSRVFVWKAGACTSARDVSVVLLVSMYRFVSKRRPVGPLSPFKLEGCKVTKWHGGVGKYAHASKFTCVGV